MGICKQYFLKGVFFFWDKFTLKFQENNINNLQNNMGPKLGVISDKQIWKAEPDVKIFVCVIQMKSMHTSLLVSVNQ